MSIGKQDWKFTQVFGDKNTAQQVADEDIISAIAFDTTGMNYFKSILKIIKETIYHWVIRQVV